MTNIRLEIKDWLFNAGLVGMYRILKHADQDVIKKDNYIEFSSSAFEKFEDYYFDYFIETYHANSAWFKAVEFFRNQMPELLEGGGDQIDEKKVVEFIKTFGKSLDAQSYRRAYEIIIGNSDYIKEKITNLKEIEGDNPAKVKLLKEIYDFLTKKDHKKIIQAKYIIYAVINKYWSDISFLNRQQVKKNMYELYRKDFIEPILKLSEAKTDKKKIFGHCIVCNSIINKKSDCSMGMGWLKRDLDVARKTSVYWNYKPNIMVCPICNLTYSCIPAGFVTCRAKGLFINDNTSIDGLIGINSISAERFHDVESMEDIENTAYINIINMIRQVREKNMKREIENIQLVKYDSEKGYTFNILSKQIIKIIEKSKNELDRLSQLYDIVIDKKNRLNLYSEVIDRIYRNVSLYPLLHFLMSLALRKKNKDMFANIVFKINMNYIGGDMPEKKIFVMKKLGVQLKEGYIEREEPKKIQGIAYRLLNNLKTKNVNNFLDVVINSHMHIGKEVPTIFVECIDEPERFQAYGYAFLLGLTGQEYRADDKNSNEKQS